MTAIAVYLANWKCCGSGFDSRQLHQNSD